MNCKKCGAELPENAKVCPKCGTVIAAKTQFTTKAQANAFSNESPLRVLRSVTRPFAVTGIVMGLITVAITFIWIMMFGGGQSADGYSDIVEKACKILGLVSYIAFIVTTFIGLVIAGLMIAQTVISGTRIRKQYLKTEMPAVILNGVLSILMLVFVILVVANIFGDNKFKADWPVGGEGKTYVGIGEKTHSIILWSGLVFGLIVYFNNYCKTFNRRWYLHADTNTKIQRVFAINMGELAICLALPVLLAIVAGFLGELTTGAKDLLPLIKSGVYYAGIYVGQFVTLALLISVITTLCQVGVLFLKDDDNRTVNIIVWGIMAAALLALFIVYAVFFKYDTESSDMPKWLEQDGAKTCAIVALITYIVSLGTGIYGMVRAKNYINPVKQ